MNNIIVRLIVSVVFMAIGVVGLIMPILPGWLFFGFAAIVLFPNAPLTQKSVARIEQQFPWTRRMLRFFIGER